MNIRWRSVTHVSLLPMLIYTSMENIKICFKYYTFVLKNINFENLTKKG